MARNTSAEIYYVSGIWGLFIYVGRGRSLYLKGGALWLAQFNFQSILFYKTPLEPWANTRKEEDDKHFRHIDIQIAHYLHLVLGMKCWAQGLSDFFPHHAVKRYCFGWVILKSSSEQSHPFQRAASALQLLKHGTCGFCNLCGMECDPTHTLLPRVALLTGL